MSASERPGAEHWVPLGAGPAELSAAAQSCRGCELWRGATQTVFGDGPSAVTHFHFEERGKRRIHRSPAIGHVQACAPWLDAELSAVGPAVIMCLGATAARAVLGRPARVGEERGRLQPARGGRW